MQKKIVFVSTHPIQYQVPIFKRLYKRNNQFLAYFDKRINKNTLINDHGFQKKIKWGKELTTGYKYEIFKKNKNFFINSFKLYNILKSKKIDYIILSGWNNLFYKTTFILAKVLKIKLILRCENNFSETHVIKKKIKILFLSFFFKHFFKFIAIGKKNKQMYMDCGISEKKILKSNYSIDNNFFTDNKMSKTKNVYLKKLYDVNNKKIFLFVGKFIKRKGLNVLLNSIINLKSNSNFINNSMFLLIGQGPELNNIKQFIKSENLNNVKLINFQSQKNLKYFYKFSNFLILPSYYETWGLVVNEAMAMGKPSIVSKSCGSANDLVINNKNGFIFKKGNSLALSDIIIKVFNDNDIENRLQKEVIKTQKMFTIARNVEDILRICK